MLATKLYPLLPTTPGTANLTNFPKRKTPQSATLQSLYINKNERTLISRFVVVGFLYSFGSSRQDFQIFFELMLRYNISVDQFLLDTPTQKDTKRRQLDALLDDMSDNGIRIVTATAKEISEVEKEDK